MKFIHTSDLHIGKRVNELSMLEDQRYILNELLRLVEVEQPDLVILAGDIYDKSAPAAEAVQVFDSFLTSLAALTKVAAIAGNHDSAERLAFGASLMRGKGVYIAPAYGGSLLHFDIGDCRIYLMPFLRPSTVRPFAEEEIPTYTGAVRWAIEHEEIDSGHPNILVAHQFVTGALCSESEEISVGGLDNVEAGVFANFDYVALGHIHRSQKMGAEHIRYAGTPLKYSFSEALHQKSVVIGELKAKEDLTIRTAALKPLRDMRELKGPFADLTDLQLCAGTEDYVHITLTDEEEIVDAVSKLRLLYPNILRLDYDNKRTRALGVTDQRIENKSPNELFSEFYLAQNGTALSGEQEKICNKFMSELWGGEE